MDNSNTGDLYRSNDNMKRIMKSDETCEENAPHDLWDSLESDTESLVQEKAYQRELQKRILNSVIVNSSSYNDNSPNLERSDHEDGCDPQPDVTETHGDQNTMLARQMPPWDEYADLRYDPDWRKKLARSEFLQTNYSIDSNEDPGEALRRSEHVSPKEMHKYLVVHSPVSSEIDFVSPKPMLSSFHLHPPQDQDTGLSVLQSSSVSLESMPCSISDKTMNIKHRINNQKCAAGILQFSSPRQRQQAQSQRQYEGENQKQNIDKLNTVTMQRRHSQNVRPTSPREDIVERNKVTLGMNKHKQGSYLKAYEHRGGKPDDANQPLQSDKDTTSTDGPGSPDNSLNPELIWIQKTQKLKTHNQSKHLERSRFQHHRTKPRGHLNQPVEKQHSQTPSEKQTLSTPDSGSVSHCSYSSAPTINLNINLNTHAKLAEPFINPEPQNQLYTLALPPSPQWRIRNDKCNSHFKGPGYTLRLPLPPAGTVDHESMRKTNKNNIRISPAPFKGGFASNAPQLVEYYGEESKDFAHTFQTYSGAYPVLPPIGENYQTDNKTGTELCSGRPEEATNSIHRSSSEGYLVQLEKQKQKQATTTYKREVCRCGPLKIKSAFHKQLQTYTLKDYKGLNRDVKLGGLGPSNTVAEDVAERIRQQKLYSNVIWEQNKKISRIPFVMTRNPVGSDNKDNIPRNKALEYAKTIAKPKAPEQLKKRPKDKIESERVFENSAYLQFRVDLTQLSTLHMLKKRHEQEKQVVELPAPSVSSH